MSDLDFEQLIKRIEKLEGLADRADTREYTTGGGGSGPDADAIHDNVAGEINALTEKTTPATSDMMLIEDAAASWAKKKVSIYKLLGGWSAVGDALSSISGTLVFSGGPGRAHLHELEMPIWSSSPASPAAGFVRVYIDTSGRLALKNSAGVVTVFTLTSHDHTGGNGAQIDHVNLANKGTNTHAQIDTHLAETTSAHGGIREKLVADRTYYVRTDGNDSNTGLVDSAGGAFLTIQKAVDVVATLDINGKTVTIQVRDGSYTAAVSLKNVVGFATDGNLVLQGNTANPGNVEISTSGSCIGAQAIRTTWDIKGFKLTSSAGNAFSISTGSSIRFSDINFGACPSGQHILAVAGSTVTVLGNCSISGGGTYHIYCYTSQIICQSRTITFLATVAFNTFVYTWINGSLVINANTYSLGAFSVTGTRYRVLLNSVIFTNGGGANYFPGNAAGVSDTGGQYF